MRKQSSSRNTKNLGGARTYDRSLSRISISKEMLKTISWNCGGLGGLRKLEAIKEIIKYERLDILLLEETKMTYVEAKALSCRF